MPNQFSTLESQSTPNSVHPWYKTWWGILCLLVALLIGSFAVAFGIAFFQLLKSAGQQTPNTAWLPTLTKVDNAEQAGKNFTLGSKQPKITIVEFSDFGCVHCKNEYQVLRNLVLSNPSDYKFVYRDYPVVTDNSIVLAHAARCAGEQGFFWQMHDYLFANQGLGTQEEVLKGAVSVGANSKLFATCMDSEKFASDISTDLNVGKKFNLSGTPTIFINNYQLPAGEIPEETLKEIISEIQKNNQ
jgi:protein-disulfide isomerase